MHQLADSVMVEVTTVPIILEKLGWDRINLLKIDIEGYESEALESMFETDILESRVKQLAFEMHLQQNSYTTIGMHRRWTIMKRLEDIGFKRWYSHLNPASTFSFNGEMRSCCYEMVYINTAFLTEAPSNGSSLH